MQHTTHLQVKKVDPGLVDVNTFLRAYKSVWDEMVDSWLVIQIGDPQVRDAKDLEQRLGPPSIH